MCVRKETIYSSLFTAGICDRMKCSMWLPNTFCSPYLKLMPQYTCRKRINPLWSAHWKLTQENSEKCLVAFPVHTWTLCGYWYSTDLTHQTGLLVCGIPCRYSQPCLPSSLFTSFSSFYLSEYEGGRGSYQLYQQRGTGLFSIWLIPGEAVETNPIVDLILLSPPKTEKLPLAWVRTQWDQLLSPA